MPAKKVKKKEKVVLFTKESLFELSKRVDLAQVILREVKGKTITMDYFIADLDCPFCSEHNSSMVIKGNKYYCFNCEASGDAVTFLMTYKLMTFEKAIKYLAKMFDVEMETIK